MIANPIDIKHFYVPYYFDILSLNIASLYSPIFLNPIEKYARSAARLFVNNIACLTPFFCANSTVLGVLQTK